MAVSRTKQSLLSCLSVCETFSSIGCRVSRSPRLKNGLLRPSMRQTPKRLCSEILSFLSDSNAVGVRKCENGNAFNDCAFLFEFDSWEECAVALSKRLEIRTEKQQWITIIKLCILCVENSIATSHCIWAIYYGTFFDFFFVQQKFYQRKRFSSFLPNNSIVNCVCNHLIHWLWPAWANCRRSNYLRFWLFFLSPFLLNSVVLFFFH